jgi:hypothetical protein
MMPHLGHIQRPIRPHLHAKRIADINGQCGPSVAIVLRRARPSHGINRQITAHAGCYLKSEQSKPQPPHCEPSKNAALPC